MAVLANNRSMIGIDYFMMVIFYVFEPVVLYYQMAVIPDPSIGVVLDVINVVLFSMNKNLLLSFLILEPDLIESISSLGGICFYCRDCFVWELL